MKNKSRRPYGIITTHAAPIAGEKEGNRDWQFYLITL